MNKNNKRPSQGLIDMMNGGWEKQNDTKQYEPVYGNSYSEEDVKELCYKAFMSRTDEDEFRAIHHKEPRVVFEKWWLKNKKKSNDK